MNVKNKSLEEPLQIEGVTIYGRGELTESEAGINSIIGEFSRVRNSVLGSFVRIDRNNFIMDTKIGSYSYTGPFDMIFNCVIGKFTSISYGVTIGPPEHDYSLLSTHPFIYNSNYNILEKDNLLVNNKLSRTLYIGNDVWIGCNATILRGIQIGDGAIIGANSLVNKDVPPYAIVAGSPAKIIKFRFPTEIIKRLQKIKWWNWEISKIRRNSMLFKNSLSLDSLDCIL